jgi:hypothetical protein
LATDDTLFLAGVQAALTAAEDIYTNWESEMTSYNSDADDYNDDVATYNDWLADEERDEDDEPEVPERPCPPGDIEAIEGTLVYYNDADAFDTADYEDQAFAAEYVENDDGADDVVDSWAYGFLRSAVDFNNDDGDDYSGEYSDDAMAGKVFGRFGQGKLNMPDMLSPVRYADPSNADDLRSSVMISIFPTIGDGWNNGAAIDSDDIKIEVSGAALSWSEILYVPSASGSATDLDDTDFAKVLSASAMVMAASIAALY